MNIYQDLLRKVQNIFTPYEYHEFERIFSSQKYQLTPEQEKEIENEFKKKAYVLNQEKMKASDVTKLGVYYKSYAFSGDDRITNWAETLYRALKDYQINADLQGKSLYQYLSELLPDRFVRFWGLPRGAVAVAPVRPALTVERERQIQVSSEVSEIKNAIKEIAETIATMRGDIDQIKERLSKLEQRPVPQPAQPTLPPEIKKTGGARRGPIISDETRILYNRFIKTNPNAILLNSFQKFLDKVKEMYPTKAKEMNDLSGLLDETDFKAAQDAANRGGKGFGEALDEALKILVRNVPPEVPTKEMEEKELAKGEKLQELEPRIDEITRRISNLIDQYNRAKESGDEETAKEISNALSWTFGISEDEISSITNVRQWVIDNLDRLIGV